MTNSEARKRNQAAQTPQQPYQQPNAPGVDSGTIACACGHGVEFHHERRGCGYFGFSVDDRCPCELTTNAAVAAIVGEHVTAALAEVESQIEAAQAKASWAASHTEDPDQAQNSHIRALAYRRASRIVRDYREGVGR